MNDDGSRSYDTFLIVVATILLFATAAMCIFCAIEGFNPFKIVTGNISEYDLAPSSNMRETNILEALRADADPSLYDITLSEPDTYLYLDENERKPYFKSCNDYTLFAEAYNAPSGSERGTEIYGTFGIEFKINEKELSGKELEGFEKANGEAYGMLIPYYSVTHDDKAYVSCVDLRGSAVMLERPTSDGYEVIATVSDASWPAIIASNGGTAVLRNTDGTLIYGTGDYRVCIYLKQQLVCYDGSELTTEIKSPENAIYNLAVNTHSCANGILNPEGSGTLDFQVNVINEESDVAYFPGSKINVGDTLKIGVSLSQDMQKKLSNVFSSIGARGTLDLYVYSNTEKKWVKLDSQAFAKGREDFANVTLEFASEELKNGRYKLVMSYNSLFEHIEEAYEYYFVFER